MIFDKKILLLFLLLLVSCRSTRMRGDVFEYIEMEDDNLCKSEGVLFINDRNEDEYIYEYYGFNSNEIYWKCRLRIIDQRIKNTFTTSGDSAMYKTDFLRMRKLIKKKIKEEKRKIKNNISSTQLEYEYNMCLKFVSADFGQYDLNKYTECINNLKEKIKIQYLKTVKQKKELYKDLFKNDNDDNSEKKDVIEIADYCVKYVYDKKKLDLCLNVVKEIQLCENNIPQQIEEKTNKDKVFCEFYSAEKYPDELAKFDSNSKVFEPKMDKVNVARLREREYAKCLEKRELKLSEYQKFLKEECKNKSLEFIDKIK